MTASSRKATSERLRKFSCLEDLDTAALSALANDAKLVTLSAGETLFWEGEPCAGLFIVESGWLKAIKISVEGREQVVRFIRPGEMFNEEAFFEGERNLVSVGSLENACVWAISKDCVSFMIKEYPSFNQALLRNMALHLQHMLSMIEDLSFRTVEARLARALLENARKNVAFRRRWSTQSEMAAYMGTVPDVLHRVLKRLAEEKVIRVERSQITILDEERLKEVAMVLEEG